MTYILNKTNNEVLTTLLDGQLDNSTTPLTLIGKNSINFGKYINENCIKLLENFANVEQPANALVGQLWYNTSTKTLYVYDGTDFKNAIGTSRLVISGNTDQGMAPGSSALVTLGGANGYVLYKVKVSSMCSVKIFTSAAKRLSNTTDGLVYDGTFSSPGEQIKVIAPGIVGFNDEDPPSSAIPIIVTNTSGSYVSQITVTLTLLKIE